MTLNPTSRYILESLSISSKSLKELSEESSIHKNILFFALENLKLTDYILETNNSYSLNKFQIHNIKNDLSNIRSKRFEIKNILDSAKDKFFEKEDALKISKVFLTKEELDITQGLFKQLTSFLNDKSKKRTTENLKTKHVFYWGSQSYQDVLTHLYQ